MAYVTRDQILAHLDRSDAAAGDRNYDEADAAAQAVGRAIDNYCNRTFEKTAANRVMTFRPDRYGLRRLAVGDIQSVRQVRTRPDHLTDWAVLDPAAYALGEPGRLWPADALWTLPGSPFWPWAPPPTATVEVTGTFGWAAVPADVAKAALYWGVAMVQEQATGFENAQGGIAVDTGGPFRNMSLAKRLLAPYRIVSVA